MLLCATAGLIQPQEVTEDVVLQPSCASLGCCNRRDCIQAVVCPSPAAPIYPHFGKISYLFLLHLGMLHIGAAAVLRSMTDREDTTAKSKY